MAIDATKSNDFGENGISFVETKMHITGGDDAPTHDAPIGSRFFRSDQKHYKKVAAGSGADKWKIVGELVGGGFKGDNVGGASFTTVSGKKVFDVVFTTPFTDANYTISYGSEDQRVWHTENRVATGFRINSQSNSSFTGDVSWQAISVGEST